MRPLLSEYSPRICLMIIACRQVWSVELAPRPGKLLLFRHACLDGQKGLSRVFMTDDDSKGRAWMETVDCWSW